MRRSSSIFLISLLAGCTTRLSRAYLLPSLPSARTLSLKHLRSVGDGGGSEEKLPSHLVSRRNLARAFAATLVSAGAAASSHAAPADEAFAKVSLETPTTDKTQVPLSDKPFETLPSGVKIKTFDSGSGPGAAVGDTVWVQATGRLLNLNGVKFFATKDNVVDPLAGPEPFIFKVGSKDVIPGLSEGVVGLKKGGVRRIVIPASLGYSAGSRLEPQPMNTIDRNALDSVIKNPRRDSTLLFDVKLERIKNKR